MIRIIGLTTCLLVPCLATLRAQSPKQVKNATLKRVEKSIRAALSKIDQITFDNPDGYPNTLVVNYQTRTFMVHGQSRIGQYSQKPYETVGPSYKGFQLHLTVEDAGAVNAAAIPQTLNHPYWATDLDIRLLKGTNRQVYCRLSRGNRLDKDLLKQVRKAIIDLGEAPYLKGQNRPK